MFSDKMIFKFKMNDNARGRVVSDDIKISCKDLHKAVKQDEMLASAGNLLLTLPYNIGDYPCLEVPNCINATANEFRMAHPFLRKVLSQFPASDEAASE